MADEKCAAPEAPENAAPDDAPPRAYELALYLKQRARGFAALMERAFEHGAGFDYAENVGLARLALDIADDAAEVWKAVRREGLEQAVKDGRMPAAYLED